MARYSLAAVAAVIALAAVGPASASHKPAHPPRTAPGKAAALTPPAPSLDALEDKIEELTDTIADLNDRLQTLEDTLDAGAGDDADDDDSPDDEVGLDLARAHAGHPAAVGHRTLRERHREHAPAPARQITGDSRAATFPSA